MRKTKIVATIGPASAEDAVFEAMCLAGLNVARLNFSHGTHAEHQEKIDMIKRVREKLNLPVAFMLDTKGPEIRIGTFENKKITLSDGDKFTFFYRLNDFFFHNVLPFDLLRNNRLNMINRSWGK